MAACLCAGMLSQICLRAADADLSLKENWHPRTSPTTRHLWGVAYGDGRFVAVGDGGTILTSESGGEWSVVPTTFQGDLYAVRYVNGQFMAGTTNGILVSTDAQQWTYRFVSIPAFGNKPFRVDDFAHGVGRFAAIASTSEGAIPSAIISSGDGVSWTQRYSLNGGAAFHYHQCGLSFGGGAFVAVQSTFSGEHRFLRSLDGLNWQPVGPSASSLPTSSSTNAFQVRTVTYGNGLFMAAGHAYSGPYIGYLYRSTNGTVWNALGTNVWQGNFSSIAYGAGRFVALGSFAFRVSTDNGASWKGNNTLGADFEWYFTTSVCYGTGNFVAVGYNGTIVQSATVEDLSPFFISTPTNQVVQRGGTAILRSRAGGSEPLSYQWNKNGSPLINATNATLEIPNVQPSDSGSYTIVVTNPFGSVTNTPVSLNVSFARIASYAGLTIDGIPGRTYRVEFLDAVGSLQQWQALTNFVLPSSPFIWIDYETPAVPRRFYRASELP
jgi:Immunoglobulin I-set domain